MTREAFRQAQISQGTSDLLSRVGVADRAFDLGLVYIDINLTTTTDVARSSNPAEPRDFGPKKIRLANVNDSLGQRPDVPSYIGWAMLGAIREDDVAHDDDAAGNTPQDDPIGHQTNRVVNHFYDPINASGAPTGASAPDWALGTGDGFQNDFSLRNAREALWRALTLTKLVSGNATVALAAPIGFSSPPTASGESTRDETLRYAYFATLFRSLGDSVHLLQDMAQPQHTRMDLHGGRYCFADDCLIGHASYYEGFVEARVIGATTFELGEKQLFGPLVVRTEAVSHGAPSFNGYSTPNLPNYRSFFTTASGAQSLTGRGLSNYSNQGFLTRETNLGSGTGYPSPPQLKASYQSAHIPPSAVVNAAGEVLNGGSLDLLTWPVPDANLGGKTTVINMTSYGAFDEFMRPMAKSQYSLNHYTYDDHAALLLPRAVAYSAGLIDYFFRGKLDIALPDDNVYAIADNGVEQYPDTEGFRRVKVKVTNSSPAGNDMTGGVAVLVAKYHRDKRYVKDLSGSPGGSAFPGFSARSVVEDITVSTLKSVAALPVNGQIELTFDFPRPIPINASDLFLQIVYRGKMGAEDDAVVVGTKDVGEPTFFGFGNNTDYVWDQAGQRYAPLPFGSYTSPDDVLDLKVRFSSTAASPLASLVKLAVRQHAQLAVLTDVGQQTAYYDYRTSSTIQTYPTVSFQYDATQFYSPLNSSTYDANVKVKQRRGIYRQNYAAFNYPRDDVLICLVENERCSQSTLPALSPADRVAWSINF